MIIGAGRPAPVLRAPRRYGEDVDHRVVARIRERRIALGLIQQRMAELIGVTYRFRCVERSAVSG